MTVLAWLEAWAKARGLWRRGASTSGWSFAPLAAGLWRVVWWTTDGHHLHGDKFDLSDDVAWLWAHAVDTGREVRRRCPDCVLHPVLGYVQECETERRVDGIRPHPAGWSVTGGRLPVDGDRGSLIWTRPCPTCTGPLPATKCGLDGCDGCKVEFAPRGYLDTSLARVVCEGAPRRRVHDLDRETSKRLQLEGWEIDGMALVKPGDPTTRTELLRAADALMTPHGRTIDEQSANGVYGYLGEALALWLLGTGGRDSTEWPKPGACANCGGNKVKGWIDAQFHGDPSLRVECPSCHGHGTALAAYVAQQLAAETLVKVSDAVLELRA